MNFHQEKYWFFTQILLCFALFGFYAASAQNQVGEPFEWFWASAAYGTPVITNSTHNQYGVLEIKVGGRISPQNISLVGGLNNSLIGDSSSTPERFSLFLGPGYFFKDKLVFFSIHAGLSYPFYKNAPENYPQTLGLQNALDLGFRLAPKMTLGIGLNQFITNDVPAYTFRFFVQLNSK